MKCLIIEDEKIAANRLVSLINQVDKSMEITGVIQSVKKAVEWFNANPHPDLIFMDIQLADGLSFEIFEQTIVTAPVIFTTAFDEYALKAFKVNSVDYLLKPIDTGELQKALAKFRQQTEPVKYPAGLFESILQNITNTYKTKFVVKVGEHLKVFMTDEIQCFYSMEKATFLQNLQGRDYAVAYSLDQLEEMLDPARFFRISRKYIVAFKAIKDIVSYTNSRLILRLQTNTSDDLVISRERVNEFREWLEK